MTGAWRGKSLVRGDGPNGVFGVRRIGGEVTEGLAVIQPRLFGFGSGVGVVDRGEVIGSCDASITFFA